MAFLTKLTLALSRVHPLVYLLTYLAEIPAFGLLYAFVTPQGFYAPHARYEPGAVSDRAQLASSLETALHRSFDDRAGQEFVVGAPWLGASAWKLDPSSLHVDSVKSTDGTQLSFRVSLSAYGIGEISGAQTVGWSIVATVTGRPSSVIYSDPVTTYRFPDVDFSKYASPFKEGYVELFQLIFGQKPGIGVLAPALALNWQEELQLQRYLRGVKGDPSSVSGHRGRMVYLSAVVITTLGLDDIIPITPKARALVAAEAITGIVFAGLFLNALAYRASRSQQ